MRENRPPQNADHEIDARGMYVMPGFVDLHVHAGGAPKNADAEYAYKLWLAHGVTTVREMGAMMTGIVVAGRTGAAFAAQLGNMKANEEIDAIETLGLRPVEFTILVLVAFNPGPMAEPPQTRKR